MRPDPWADPGGLGLRPSTAVSSEPCHDCRRRSPSPFWTAPLQNGLIDQGRLVAAFQAWTRDKGKSLADQLVARGDLDADACAGLEAIVALHVKKHGEVEPQPGRSPRPTAPSGTKPRWFSPFSRWNKGKGSSVSGLFQDGLLRHWSKNTSGHFATESRRRFDLRRRMIQVKITLVYKANFRRSYPRWRPVSTRGLKRPNLAPLSSPSRGGRQDETAARRRAETAGAAVLDEERT